MSHLLRNICCACLLGLTLQACCPIPIPMTKPVLPKGQVIVRDARSNTAVPDASVRISRGDQHPHHTKITHEWDYKTDQNGGVETKAISESEWHMPLVMHGVPFYYWRVCVAKPGYQTVFKYWVYESEAKKTVTPMVVALSPGEHKPCPVKSLEPTLDRREQDNQAIDDDNPIIQINFSEDMSSAQPKPTQPKRANEKSRDTK